MTLDELATCLICSVCGRTRPKEAFPFGSARCRTCKRNGWVPANFLEPDPKPRQAITHGNPPWRYPLTVHQQRLLRDAQRGRCGICDRPRERLIVDHRHDHNGYVRGLLCVSCNQGLGAFTDNPDRLRAAARYLEHPVLPGGGCADADAAGQTPVG